MGAKVLGGITIADDIKIGVNAIVTKSFNEPVITIVGTPVHKLERKWYKYASIAENKILQ